MLKSELVPTEKHFNKQFAMLQKSMICRLCKHSTKLLCAILGAQ